MLKTTAEKPVPDFQYLWKLKFFLESRLPETAAKLVAQAYEEITGRTVIGFKKTRNIDATTNAHLIEVAGYDGTPATAIEVHYRGICREMRATKYYHIHLGNQDDWDNGLQGSLEAAINRVWEASRNGRKHI